MRRRKRQSFALLWLVAALFWATGGQALAGQRVRDPLTGLGYELPPGLHPAPAPDDHTLLYTPKKPLPNEGLGHQRTPTPDGVSTRALLLDLEEILTSTHRLSGKSTRNRWVMEAPALEITATFREGKTVMAMKALALPFRGWLHMLVLTTPRRKAADLPRQFDALVASLKVNTPARWQEDTPPTLPTDTARDGRPGLTVLPTPNPQAYPASTIGEEVSVELSRLIAQEGRWRLTPKGDWEAGVVVNELFEMEPAGFDAAGPPALEAMARLTLTLRQGGQVVFTGDFSHVDHGQEGEVLPYTGRGLFGDEDQRQQGYSRAISRNLQSVLEVLRQRLRPVGLVVRVKGREALINLGEKAGLRTGDTVLLQGRDGQQRAATVLSTGPLTATIQTLDHPPAVGEKVVVP